MGASWLVAHLLLWGAALGVAFLLVGAFRSLAVRTWRLEQLEVALPDRRRGARHGQAEAEPAAAEAGVA
jgi:hypothetical protein